MSSACPIILFVWLAGILSAADKVDRLRLVQADSLAVETVGSRSIQKAYGHVEMVQGDAFMKCDRATNYQDENRALLQGQVILFDGKHKLWADEVLYEGKLQTETATGHVRLETDQRTLRADWIRYDRENSRALAKGDVHFDDMIQKAIVTGQVAEYDRKADYGWVEGDPVFTKIDTTAKDTLRVLGRKMEVWGEQKRVAVTDSVRILKGDVDGVCFFAEYLPDSSWLKLSGLPRLRQKDQEMTGDTILIRLKETKFAGGMIRGKAQVISHDSTSENTLQGRQIFIEADADTIRKVIVEGQAYSRFRVSNTDDKKDEEGINTITGDRLEMTFEDNQVSWIRVESSPGLCEGTYTPVDMDTVKTGSGNRGKPRRPGPPM